VEEEEEVSGFHVAGIWAYDLVVGAFSSGSPLVSRLKEIPSSRMEWVATDGS
jgi:hypothetical protein